MADTLVADAVVVVLDTDASERELDRVMEVAGAVHAGASITRGDAWAAIAVGDGMRPVAVEAFLRLEAVDRVVPVSAPYRLASREVFDRDTTVRIARDPRALTPLEHEVGGGRPIAIIADCSAFVRGEEQLRIVALAICEAGVTLLHVGRFPSGGSEGGSLDVAQLRRVADASGLGICMEVVDPRSVDDASEAADVLQVGSRSMQDFNLLRALGRADKPVILRRGFGATVEEFLLAAEYVLSYGNGRVILCESGIRTFDIGGRPRFEINAIPVIKRATHLPLVADPSQTSPTADLISFVARGAIAAGADGLFIDVIDRRSGEGSGIGIDVSELAGFIAELRPIAAAVGRRL